MSEHIDSRVATVLLFLAVLGWMGALVAGLGWYRTAQEVPTLAELSDVERQAMIEDLMMVSPGTYATAWFEPKIGYTLKRRQEISAWNDVFTSNALGYRTADVEKKPDVFRLLFVGDSWTFGMGVKEEESFARQVATLAEQQGVPELLEGRHVQAWTLALPGYNTPAQLSALRFFWSRLEPNVVILCPTPNDHHSLSTVLPNGSLSKTAVQRDRFGDEHAVVYPLNWTDSFRARERWSQVFADIRELEIFLAGEGVPFRIFFTGSWQEAIAHSSVDQAGIEASYLITPLEWTGRGWRNPRPVGHPNPAAHRLYGRLVYRLLAEDLGWPELPLAEDEIAVDIYDRRTSEVRQGSWRQEAKQILKRQTQTHIPTSFRPGSEARYQTVGPLDAITGLMGRSTTILVRRDENKSRLALQVRPLSGVRGLYPLELTIDIPSPSGGVSESFTITENAPESLRFEVELPADVPVGAALDVILKASRNVVSKEVLTPVSVYIEAIDLLGASQR